MEGTDTVFVPENIRLYRVCGLDVSKASKETLGCVMSTITGTVLSGRLCI